MTPAIAITTRSTEQTAAVGAALAAAIAAGDVVALYGPLGAGKTQFVKGLAAGLGVPPDEPVVSPTFVLVREYQGRLRLFHLDLYRLHGADDLESLGIEELAAAPGAVIAIEWAERASTPVVTQGWSVRIEHAGANERAMSVAHHDSARIAALVATETWRGIGVEAAMSPQEFPDAK